MTKRSNDSLPWIRTDFGNLSKRSVIALFIAAGVLFISTLSYWYHEDLKADAKDLKKSFVGTVENVTYDIQGQATITINKEDFYIGSRYGVDHQIQVGDYVVKKIDSPLITLTKAGSGKILEFKRWKP